MTASWREPELTVFVSATQRDLATYRIAAMSAVRKLGYRAVGMEDYAADAAIPVERCVQDAGTADIYVGIFAWAYGHVPEGYTQSITELEYRAALRSGATILIFIVEKDQPWRLSYVDAGESSRRLEMLKHELLQHHVVEFFLTPDDLAAKVTAAVARAGFRTRVGQEVDGSIDTEELDDYRIWASEEFGYVEMTGLGVFDHQFSLPDVYVVPRLSRSRSEPFSGPVHEDQPPEGAGDGEFELDELPLVRGRHRGILVLGEPGSGKTMFLRKLLYDTLALGAPEVLGGSISAIPVLLRARRMTASQRRMGIARVIQSELDDLAPGRFGRDFAARLWNRGDLLLLIDGLDELPSRSERDECCRYVVAQTQGGTSRRVFVAASARSIVLPDLSALKRSTQLIELRPLDAAQTAEFLVKWSSEIQVAISGQTPPPAGVEYWALLRRALHERVLLAENRTDRLRSLVSSPMLLALLCVIVARGGEVPQSESEFYHECLRTMLGRWSRAKGIEPFVSLERALFHLRPFALDLHFSGRTEFSRTDWLGFIRREEDQVTPEIEESGYGEDLLTWLREGAGIFRDVSPEAYAFSHLGFQEYLASQQVVRSTRQLKRVAAVFTDAWWREVVLLLIAASDRETLTLFLYEALDAEVVETHRSFLEEFFNVAQVIDPSPFVALLEDPAASSSAKAAVLRLWLRRNDDEIVRASRSLMTHPSRDVSSLASAVCNGRDCGKGGDGSGHESRYDSGSPHVDAHTGLRFMPIPEGEFDMGAPDMSEAEGPVHRVRLGGFLLAETPVTNRQYGQFLADTGYREPAFWRDRRFAGADLPVVGVNWHDALEFCRWLSKISGLRCTLPTEAQWEYAARGSDGRRYPWGNEPPDRTRGCYWDESRPRRPENVGSFPAGRGPFGCLDQAGNVWDWCLDSWNADAYEQRVSSPVTDPIVNERGATLRVARGGTWWFSTDGLDARYRYRSPTENCTDDIGIRVAVRP